MINVSELIGDPDFTQPNGVTVIRRPCTVVNHRPSVTETQIKVTGVITIAKDRDLQMLPEADRTEEAINVFTYKPLFTTGREDEEAVQNYLSDVVVWQGNRYKVMNCMDDAQYGFCKSIAVKMAQEVM